MPDLRGRLGGVTITQKPLAVLLAVYSVLEEFAALGLQRLDAFTHSFDLKLWGEARASRFTGSLARKARAGELGIYAFSAVVLAIAAYSGVSGGIGVLVFGAIALIVVSITLLFGMDIAGEFAEGISVDNDYSDAANSTVNSTGSAFEL